jgi:hypothetical protein
MLIGAIIRLIMSLVRKNRTNSTEKSSAAAPTRLQNEGS